jgi:hypothetical protein
MKLLPHPPAAGDRFPALRRDPTFDLADGDEGAQCGAGLGFGRGSNQGNTENEKSLYHQSSIDFRCYLKLARFEPRQIKLRDLVRVEKSQPTALLRSTMIQLAWLWLRHQPTSAGCATWLPCVRWRGRSRSHA